MNSDDIETKHIGRKFQIWRYGVSHSQLLLISHKDDEAGTRYLLLFKGVEEICLPCQFHCEQLCIEKVDHRTKFTFVTPEGGHHIVAHNLFEEEDELDQSGPSKLFDSFSSGDIATTAASV